MALANPVQFDVFLSYSRKHAEWAEDLALQLKRAKFRVWFDRWELVPGQDWSQGLEKGMTQSKCCAICVGGPLEGWQQQEAEYAMVRQRRNKEFGVIPVVMPGGSLAQLQGFLELRHSVEYGGDPKRAFHELRCGIRGEAPGPWVEEALVVASKLPEKTHCFVGREEYLKELHASLQQHRHAVISANGGYGKTQTALEYIEQYAKEYESVLWLAAANSSSLLESYLEHARALNLEIGDGSEKPVVAAFDKWAAQNPRALLVYDNIDELTFIRDFWPRNAKTHILVTSRIDDLFELGLKHVLPLPLWDEGEAVKFLAERTDRPPDPAAAELAHEAGCLPLALEQAGAYIRENHVSFAEYLASFRKARVKLLEEGRVALGEYNATVATTWTVSLEKLSEPARQFLNALSHLAPRGNPFELFTSAPAELGPVLEKALTRDVPNPVKALLAGLRKYSLVTVDDAVETIAVHTLLAEVVRSLQTKEESEQWASRWANVFYAHLPKEKYYTLHPAYERTWVPFAEFFLRLAPEHPSAIDASPSGLWFGRHFDDCGRWRDAETVLTRILDARECMLGSEHPKTLTARSYLAMLYKRQGRYGEAEPLLARSLEASEQVLGAEHPDTLTSLNNLAGLYQSQGRYEEAEALFKRALDARERRLGPEHPDTLLSVNNLAALYRSQGRYGEAEPLYQQALEASERVLGTEHRQTLLLVNNLAVWYWSQGRYGEAEPLFARALEASEQVLGVEHPETLVSVHNLAALYDKQEHYRKAEPLYVRAAEGAERVLGPDHPSTKLCRHNLAILRAKMQSPDKK